MNRFRRASMQFLTSATVLCVLGCAGGDGGNGGVPEDVIRENTLGTAHLGQQEWDDAAAAFRRGLALREAEPLLLNNLAVALMQDGNPDEAENHLLQAVQLDPDYPYAHYNLGLIETNRGNFAEAAAHFEVVAAFDPEDVLTQYNIGAAYSGQGDDAKAEAGFRRALALDPGHVSSLYALGRQLLARGDREEGGRLISDSQTLRARSGLDTGVGLQYGEQGPYAMGVDYPGDALGAPAPIDVAFESLRQHDTGSGSAVWALARMGTEERAGVIVASGPNVGALTAEAGYAEIVPPAPAGTSILGLAAGDGDDDGSVELYALAAEGGARTSLLLIEQDDSGKHSWSASSPAELPGPVLATDLTLVDSDHDGDLDLFCCWISEQGSGCALATNDGSGRFVLRPSSDRGLDLATLAGDRVRVALSDFDNDRDVDLLVAHEGGIHVLTNLRDGSFADVGEEVGLGLNAAGLAAMAVADVDKNGWMDLVVGGRDGLWLFANRRGKFQPRVAIAGASAAVESLAVFDADNDGFLDVVAAATGGAPVAYRNLGRGEWKVVPAWLGPAPGEVPVAALDADADGDLDLVSVRATAVAILANRGGNAQQWITVDSRGEGDNRFGIGAKVEIAAGALRQKFEVDTSLPIHAGLADRTKVDSVRHLWPGGVLQDEVEQNAGGRVQVTQLDRKGTSCPVLYVWRDGGWGFVTDFLGGAAIGYQKSPGQFGTPDTDEYVKLEPEPTVDADGRIRLRVNNQLQEIIWFDQLELVAVDHPAGSEVFPNERLMPAPPWPAFELFVSDDVRPIASARDVADGADLTHLLAERDRRYVDNFELLAFKGYAEPHAIELDLGRFSDRERVILLLDGWIDYADSTSNVSAHQAGLALSPPALTIADGRGGFVDTGHLMGFPAGLPKTMAVPLSGLFPSSDHRVRIRTNMRIYWDRARVMVGGVDAAPRVQRRAPLSAHLSFGGYPVEASPDGAKPFGYDPRQVSSASLWKAHVGRYTAFGDVTQAVTGLDDRLVTTRSGDAIELSFAAPPPAPAGFRRTWLLFADGFGKDMDPNSAASNSVGPIPFHGMPTYPYPESLAPPTGLADEIRTSRLVPDSERGWPGAPPPASVNQAALIPRSGASGP